MIINDTLYKRSFYGALLRCFTHHETATTLEQAHEGLCEGKFFTKALYTKLFLIGYYWPSMKEYCKEHVRTYLHCQKHSNIEKQPTQELNIDISP